MKRSGLLYYINLCRYVQHQFVVRRAVKTLAEVYAKKLAVTLGACP